MNFLFKKIILFILLFLTSCCFILEVKAQVRERKAVIVTGNFNFDSIPDRLVAFQNENGSYIPDRIIWGKSSGIKDSIDSPEHERLKVKETKFIYPNMMNLKGRFIVSKINQDSLDDITFLIRGKCISDTIECIPLNRTVIIFGQRYLDTIHSIDITEIYKNQTSPFYAGILKNGFGLSNPDFRDPTGMVSYELNKVNFPVEPPEKPREEKIYHPTSIVEKKASGKLEAEIIPNPAENIVNIKFLNYTNSIYLIYLFSSQGQILFKDVINFYEQNNYIYVLNIAEFPSGLYKVIIQGSNGNSYESSLLIIH